jgi:hypothetical protein
MAYTDTENHAAPVDAPRAAASRFPYQFLAAASLTSSM